MVRFPQISKGDKDSTFLTDGNVPYAKRNFITKTGGLQTGFLTEHTLFFVRKGSKRFHFQDGIVTVGEHEIILVKRGVYTISEQLSSSGTFEALMLFVPEQALRKLVTLQAVKQDITLPHFAIVQKDSLIHHFEQGYVQLFDKPAIATGNMLWLKLQELFLLLAATSHGQAISTTINSWISKDKHDIAFIVNEHIFQPLDIPDYARLCCRSVASFKRDFEKHFKTSPRKWINEQRIQHAHLLLQTTDQSISEVASLCGFESSSHFIKLYKTRFNTTPGKR